MKKDDLQVDVIYHLKNGNEGLKICVLQSNRNNEARNRAMKESCQKVEMQQPGIFTDARVAYEAGYVLLDVESKKKVPAAEVDEYLVVVDGNTRFWAYRLAQVEEKTFTYHFQFKEYESPQAFMEAYRGMNRVNTPTTTADLARDILASMNNPVLARQKQYMDDGLVAKAAAYATIGREIGKDDIAKICDGKTPNGFDDEATLALYAELYAALSTWRALSPGICKGAVIWKFNSQKMNGASDKVAMKNLLCDMYLHMGSAMIVRIRTAKCTKTETKDVVITKCLEEAYQSCETKMNH